MYKEFNNYYIKTLVRLSKDLGCYDEISNNIKVIFDCIKSIEKPFFPHVILGEMKFKSFSNKLSLKSKYLERITPQLARDIHTMILNEADYRKDIINFESMKSGIIGAISASGGKIVSATSTSTSLASFALRLSKRFPPRFFF